MNRVAVFAGLAVVSLGLAGCQSIFGGREPIGRAPQRQSAGGIEGSWVDPNGIVSTFSNGTFQTRTTDTNSVLATGTYTYSSRNMVQIAMHSRLRNTDSTVNCALVGADRLNCTSSSGSQFSLTRASAPTQPAG